MDILSNKSKTYKLGRYTITQQAFIIFILGCVITVAVSLSGFMVLFLTKGVPNKQKLALLISVFLISAIILAYTCFVTYVTNCLSVGNCNLLAWIYVVVAISYTAYYLLVSRSLF